MPRLRRFGALLAVLATVVGFAVAGSAPASALAPRAASAGLVGTAATPGLASISVGTTSACAIRTGGAIACWGADDVADNAPNGTFVQVSVGSDEACALQTDGTMQCWGADDPSPELAGSFRSIAVGTAAGATYVCGLGVNSIVTCTDGAQPDTFRQVSVADNAACGVQTNGTVTCWGTDAQLPTPGTYTQVGVGADQACALQTDGHVACWGTGALNTTPEQTHTFSQLDMSDGIGCGLETDGAISCFGTDRDGNPVGSSPGGTYVAVGIGQLGACGVTTSGKADCWTGSSTPPHFNFGHPQVSAGTSTTCGIRTNGTLECWGLAQDDQPTGDTTYTQIATGATHSCALLTDGTISCWGDDTAETTGTPTSGSYVQIAVGDAFSCALANNGTLSCWGASDSDAVNDKPTGTFVAISAGTDRACAISTDGAVTCWGASEVSDIPSPPSNTFVDVSVGNDFACGVQTDGTLTCWGSVTEAVVAVVAPSGTYSTVAAGSGYACAVSTEGNTTCRGNAPAALPNDHFVQLSAGSDYACGITDEAAVECWGDGTPAGAPSSLIVAPNEQTPTFENPESAVVGGSFDPVVERGGSNLPVTLSATSTACSFDGTTVVFLHAEQCTLHLSEGGDDDYLPAELDQSFSIGKGTVPISVPDVAGALVGTSATLAPTSDPNDDGDFTYSIDPAETHCSLRDDGVTIDFDHVGDCVVDVDQASTDDYTENSTTTTIPVGQGTAAISVDPVSGAVVGGSTALSPTSPSEGDFSYVIAPSDKQCELEQDGSTIDFEHVGDCSVTIDQSATSDYVHNTRTITISVSQGTPADGQVDVPTSGLVGDTATLTASSTSTGAFTYSVSSPNEQCGLDPSDSTKVDLVHVGECTVTAHQASTDDYLGTSFSQTFTISPAQAGVGLSSTGATVVNSQVQITASPSPAAASVGSMTFSVLDSQTDGRCQLESDSGPSNTAMVDLLHAGRCVIQTTLSEPADGDYVGVTVNKVIDIARADAAISVTVPTDPVVGQPSLVVSASSVSGGNFTYSSSSSSCAISADGDATLLHAGTCEVDVEQTGTHDYNPGSAPREFTVAPATTASDLHVGPSTLTADVSTDVPSTAVPTGTVTFLVDSKKVGQADVDDTGVASLPDSIPTDKKHNVTAEYAAPQTTPDFVASSDSTARDNPKLKLHAASSTSKTKSGWYRSPVTVTFACTATTAPLVGSCPATEKLTKSQANQSVSTTILAQDGGAASASITGINIDQTKPTITIAGVVDGNTYVGTAPKVRCLAQDHLSGLAGGCKVQLKTDKSGLTRYTATAKDEAGNVQTAKGSYRVQRYYLREAIYDSVNNVYYVQTKMTYTLVALTDHRPRYIRPSRGRPHQAGPKLSADGRQGGFKRWSATITFAHSLAKHPHWNIGIKAGGKLTVLPLMVSG